MARLSLPLTVAVDTKKMSKIVDQSGKKMMAGAIVDRLKNPKSSKIMSVSEKMITNGILEPTAIKSPNLLSEKILAAMGCTIISKGLIASRNYTLISDQVDTETIDNPAKIDLKQLRVVKKQKITIDSVFKNQNDSIFSLDTALPNNYQQANIKSKGVVEKTSPLIITNIVIKAVDLSLNTHGVRAVRAFKEI